MTHQLKSRDIIALGFMTFALFVGAGNIIFPPMVGLQAGEHVWTAAIGFLITAVGLPVLTVVALAKVGGGVESLSTPIGKVAGILLAVVCYLAVGPLFATPRTATVSFEVGIAPLTGDGPLPLLIYSVIYFALVILVSLYPGKLLDTVGNFLAPLKIIALIVLAVAAIIWPAGPISDALEAYRTAPFSNGFVNGYLTMDTLGAMVFGIVIVNAARSRGVSEARLLTRYTVWAGLMAGVGLTLLYLALFRLGSDSATLVDQSANGAAILHAYVQHTFGGAGSFLLAALRWLLLGNLADHLGVLLFAQLLHAATFGSFHAAAIHFVQRSFGPNQQGQGQALYAALAGTGGALGALYAGYSWESLGAAWTFAIASLVALAAAIIIALRLHEERA